RSPLPGLDHRDRKDSRAGIDVVLRDQRTFRSTASTPASEPRRSLDRRETGRRRRGHAAACKPQHGTHDDANEAVLPNPEGLQQDLLQERKAAEPTVDRSVHFELVDQNSLFVYPAGSGRYFTAVIT